MEREGERGSSGNVRAFVGNKYEIRGTEIRAEFGKETSTPTSHPIEEFTDQSAYTDISFSFFLFCERSIISYTTLVISPFTYIYIYIK